MRLMIVLLVVAAVGLAACGPRIATPDNVRQRSCDDGGDGGVIIDGVCL